MKPVIFLDMDGVLCTARAHAAFHGPGGMWRHLDPIAVRMVERLCVDFNALLVLSSTWRLHFDRDAMTHILCTGGFRRVDWHENWRTPTVARFTATRGDEVKAWLSENPTESYLILDDDFDFGEDLRPRLVLTHSDDGISHGQYEDARRILSLGPRVTPS